MVVLCRFGVSMAGKTLAFSRPSRTDAWCECLSVWSYSGWAFFPLACSLLIYLAVYYLCHLQMPSSSSCPSPATNMYARLFPSHPTLRNLGSGGGEGWRSDLLHVVPMCSLKLLCEERRQSIKNIEIFLVDNLRVYCCEPSQHTGNQLVIYKVSF
jgi:hypothetical protein